MKQEIWLDIKGYEGIYQVSTLGRVKSLEKVLKSGRIKKEKILSLSSYVTEQGQLIQNVHLSKNGENISFHPFEYLKNKRIYNTNNLKSSRIAFKDSPLDDDFFERVEVK
jgi:hypothetical protein